MMSKPTMKVVAEVETLRWRETKAEERRINQKNKEYSKEF